MTMPILSRKRSLRAALTAVIGVVLLAGCMVTSVPSARAADDEEDVAFDTKIIRQILRTLGLRSGEGDGIDYRERSPLVVPPSRNLPAPASKTANEKVPAWPKDPDLKRRREAKAQSSNSRGNINWDADTRPLAPNALRGNGSATGNQGQPVPNNADMAGPMKPSELGYKGGLFSGIFGGPKEEYKTFTGEQPRASLIEPPTGYRTPSPYQPYGVGKEKWTPPASTDRHEPVR